VQPLRRGTPEGVLRGLQFAVKDVFGIAGHVTGAGHPAWLASHAAASEDAPVIRRLLGAGASLDGVTVMDELAVSFGGESIHYGAPVNPKAPGRVTGGSSSGSAAAVAGGLVDFALGTDSGGSVRVPASYCGLYGFRPTHGRIALEGVFSPTPGLDTVGWFARDATMLERVGRTLLDWREPAPAAPRLVVAADAFALAEHAAPPQFFSKAKMISLGLEAWGTCFRVIQTWEAWQSLREWVSQHRPRLGAMVQERFDWAARLTLDELRAAQAQRAMIATRLHDLMEGSILVLPTASGPAPLRNASPGVLKDLRSRTLALTCVAGLAGLPQVTMPVPEVGGLPLGVSMIGSPGYDEILLTLAKTLSL
jgi:amidase